MLRFGPSTRAQRVDLVDKDGAGRIETSLEESKYVLSFKMEFVY